MQNSIFAGVTPAQSALIAYWAAHRDGQGRVARQAIDPGAFKAMLSSVSIIEFGRDGRCRFRLAGSGLCEMFGMTELRGLDVEAALGERAEALLLGLAAALERAVPVGGVSDTLAQSPDRAHAWLRLPLTGRDGALTQVLCFLAINDSLPLAYAVAVEEPEECATVNAVVEVPDECAAADAWHAAGSSGNETCTSTCTKLLLPPASRPGPHC